MAESSSSTRYLYVLSLIVGVALLWGARVYFLAPEGWGRLAPDEAQRAWHALRVTNGDIPYRDFWVQYTPFSFYWHALLFEIFGPSLLSIRIGLFLFGSALLSLILLVTRKLAGGIVPVLAMALFISYGIPCFNSGYPAWYAMTFSLGSLALLLRRNPGFISVTGAGMMAGLAVLAKINVGVFSFLAFVVILTQSARRGARLVSTAVCFLAVAWLLRGLPLVISLPQFVLPLALVLFAFDKRVGESSIVSGRLVGSGIIGFAAVMIIGSLPFLAVVGIGGLWNAFVSEPLRFAPLIAYRSPIWNLRGLTYLTVLFWILAAFGCLLWPKKRFVTGAFIIMGALPFVGEASNISNQFHISAGFRFILIPTLLAISAIGLLGKGFPSKKRHVGIAAVWAAFAAVQVHPGQNNMHTAWALIALWPLLGAMGAFAPDRRCGRLLLVLPIVLCIAQMSGQLMQLKQTEWACLDTARCGILVPATDAGQLEEVSAELKKIAPNSPILDLTSGCLVAFLSERPCPLRQAYLWSRFMTEDAQRAEITTLEKDPPPVAVRRAKAGGQFRWDSIRRYAPVLGEWVEEHYAGVQSIGPFEILVKSSPSPLPPVPASETTAHRSRNPSIN